MAKASEQQSLIAARRLAVEPLAIRRVSTRDIARAIASQGYRQPATEDPWHHATIARDVRFLEHQWEQEAKAQFGKAKGRLLAELREMRRQAWLKSDYKTLLQSCAQEAKLLGLDAPEKVDITHQVREWAEAEGFDPEEAIREVERIVKAVDR